MRDIIRADSCVSAWLQAVRHLETQNERRDYNLVLEIRQPMTLKAGEHQVKSELDRFLKANDKHSISTVINTIFPASLYAKHGKVGMFKLYKDEVYPRLSHHPHTKWGTYFLRMTSRGAENANLLDCLIEKLRNELATNGPKRAVYELNMVDIGVDIPIYDGMVDRKLRMSGPCLSHLSFKVKADRSLLLTAIYRSHWYIERALGNFFGLALLQDFVAKESGTKPAELVCLSTMAILDTDRTSVTDVKKMMIKCNALVEERQCKTP
jgi:hypothetical protein